MKTAKQDKVYTHHLSGNLTAPTAAQVIEKNVSPFVAEEDVLVIGWYLECCRGAAPNQNDGTSVLDLALVENGVNLIDRIDGVLEIWNTAPPFGQSDHKNHVVMFPKGQGIHLTEGESIGMDMALSGKSAGSSFGEAGGCLYYVRE